MALCTKVMPLAEVVDLLEGDPLGALQAVKWADTVYCTHNFIHTVAVSSWILFHLWEINKQ